MAAIEADKALARGTLLLKLGELSTRPDDCKMQSGLYEIGGLNWYLEAKRIQLGSDSLSVYAYAICRTFSPYWKADVLLNFGVQGTETEDWVMMSRPSTVSYSANTSSFGVVALVKWADLLDPVKGYLREDSVVIGASIAIHKLVGICYTSSPTLNIREPGPLSDIVIRVSGNSEYEFTDFHVSKVILSLHSPVIAAEFKEPGNKLVEIKEVEPSDFELMLNFIYSPKCPENVEILVVMGDRFGVTVILDSVERYLIADRFFTTLRKLALCDRHHLAQLKEVVLARMSKKEVRDMANTDDFKCLSKDMQNLVLQKLVKRKS